MRADIKLSGDGIYFLTSCTEMGFYMYFYVKVDRGKKQSFLRQLKHTESFNLYQYGKILECGPGKIPSTESIAKMRHEYHFATPAEALI